MTNLSFAGLEMHAGDLVGILGPNGCGKTTLLHTLAGLRASPQGEPCYQDKPLKQMTARQRAQRIGILLQTTHFYFPQTVAEYCLDARYPHQPQASDQHLLTSILSAMQLLSFRDRNVLALSGGEQRRVAIAALLMQTPVIYLLDEPTNHLDIASQHLVMNYLRHELRDKTIVMALHDINLAARYCNKILLQSADGSLQYGSATDILSKENLSQVYQYPIDVIRQDNHTYWLPSSVINV